MRMSSGSESAQKIALPKPFRKAPLVPNNRACRASRILP